MQPKGARAPMKFAPLAMVQVMPTEKPLTVQQRLWLAFSTLSLKKGVGRRKGVEKRRGWCTVRDVATRIASGH